MMPIARGACKRGELRNIRKRQQRSRRGRLKVVFFARLSLFAAAARTDHLIQIARYTVVDSRSLFFSLQKVTVEERA